MAGKKLVIGLLVLLAGCEGPESEPTYYAWPRTIKVCSNAILNGAQVAGAAEIHVIAYETKDINRSESGEGDVCCEDYFYSPGTQVDKTVGVNLKTDEKVCANFQAEGEPERKYIIGFFTNSTRVVGAPTLSASTRSPIVLEELSATIDGKKIFGKIQDYYFENSFLVVDVTFDPEDQPSDYEGFFVHPANMHKALSLEEEDPAPRAEGSAEETPLGGPNLVEQASQPALPVGGFTDRDFAP